ncbi:hypothetical protein Desru_0015 [Desulforamulus ruminis DSM 2154]|uniref:Uncharacterized protein n=1 Tax=Desulforamulus ruminis (strain ATCC 23193 / DSM 2154 / NCIMB 8452 / DL) TaxID=696281 RepID=F6DL12_DESRL|nr:hypothetical protein Desru_0015 [Desulforamulus ruminis DSM 2154]
MSEKKKMSLGMKVMIGLVLGIILVWQANRSAYN